jgi:hypothetical protein
MIDNWHTDNRLCDIAQEVAPVIESSAQKAAFSD